MSEFLTWLVRLLIPDIAAALGRRVTDRRRDGPKANTVAYGWGMQTLAAVVALLFGVPGLLLTAALILVGDKSEMWVAAILFGGIGLAALTTFVDGLFRRLEWTEVHVTMRTWRGTRRVRWSDIEALDYKSGLRYWRIALPGAAGFAIQMSMGGAHAFIDSAIRRQVQIMEDGAPTSKMPDYS